MEIDDRWQSAYGDLEFDALKFPDAPGMVRQLHAMGFKVTVWVMPFVEENSDAYRCARARLCLSSMLPASSIKVCGRTRDLMVDSLCK